jgi:hypothetical protein
VFDYSTAETLAEYLVKEALFPEPEEMARDSPQTSDDQGATMLSDLEQLTEEELVALLAEELASIEDRKPK